MPLYMIMALRSRASWSSEAPEKELNLTSRSNAARLTVEWHKSSNSQPLLILGYVATDDGVCEFCYTREIIWTYDNVYKKWIQSYKYDPLTRPWLRSGGSILQWNRYGQTDTHQAFSTSLTLKSLLCGVKRTWRFILNWKIESSVLC